jgi:glucose-6-phosphate 1-dehydrogenase
MANENTGHPGSGEARITVTPSDQIISAQECSSVQRSEPCAIVIMGATGDLTARKLIPALFNLYKNGGLPDPCIVVGCGRTKLSDDDFRQKMTKAIISLGNPDHSTWQTFAGSLFYRSIIYDDVSSFTQLSASLQDLDQKHKTRGNRIFYLALPPTLYRPVAQMLGKTGLSNERHDDNGWSRLVVEKPFGRDLESAIELDRGIHQYFREHQIFRIDHYLAKETVQNVLMFRFANAIFEPVWNRRYIENISITATETLGVEHRAGYYEQSGVLRDMFQNHMMQLLALTAMEPPSRFVAEHVRDERIKVFRALRPFPIDQLREHLALGQYDTGTVNGETVPAYRQEPGVNPDSLTPTFARMKVFVDNWRWQGVPFFLTSGKRLAQKITEIAIQFKEVPHSMFRRIMGGDITANRLIVGIYPEEKITLTFQTKFPGTRVCLRSVTMDFNYHQNYEGPVLEAYEKVLLDCMLGDQMLFWRQDGVELCWNFLTPVLSECETCGYRADMLQFYKSGSWGTAEAEALKAY